MRVPDLRRASSLSLIAVLAALIPTAAAAQCSISGPSVLTPPGIQLCGGAGPYDYEWTGPNGFAAFTECVTVSQPGTYTLLVYDYINNLWYGPCSHAVTTGCSLGASVDGPASVCDGQTATLCGPEGNLTYAWAGPGGFSAATRCVDVQAAGSYSLVVTDPAGCSSSPATHVLQVESCGSDWVNCPRPPTFWGRQCRLSYSDVSRDRLAYVAGFVDDELDAVSWDDDLEGFCTTVRRPDDGIRKRALRQMAALVANVCMHDHPVPGASTAVGLDPATTFTCAPSSPSLGSWIAATDVELVRLADDPWTKREARRAYRRILGLAWLANHGFGVGEVCSEVGGRHRREIHPTSIAALEEEGVDAALATTLGPSLTAEMQAELSGDNRPGLVMDPPAPNPFSSRTSITFSLLGLADAPVEIAVFDIAGRRMRTLIDGPLSPGTHRIDWDGLTDKGLPARHGLYFIHGSAGSEVVGARVMLVQ
jgi:hypothetical protein